MDDTYLTRRRVAQPLLHSPSLLSPHLLPSGFIILCEDHLDVSKPCPAARELTLIFITQGFLSLFGGGVGVGDEEGESRNSWGRIDWGMRRGRGRLVGDV